MLAPRARHAGLPLVELVLPPEPALLCADELLADALLEDELKSAPPLPEGWLVEPPLPVLSDAAGPRPLLLNVQAPTPATPIAMTKARRLKQQRCARISMEA